MTSCLLLHLVIVAHEMHVCRQQTQHEMRSSLYLNFVFISAVAIHCCNDLRDMGDGGQTSQLGSIDLFALSKQDRVCSCLNRSVAGEFFV